MNIAATDGQVLYFPIDERYPDSFSIVAWLNELAVQFGRNPSVRDYAELLIPRWYGNNDLSGVIDTVLQWVKDNVQYMPDPEGTEYVINPLVLLERIVHFTGRPPLGDCDDHALLLASVLRTFGIDARIVGVKERPDSTWFDHVIVVVANGQGGLRFLDPCAKLGPQPDYSNAELLVIDNTIYG